MTDELPVVAIEDLNIQDAKRVGQRGGDIIRELLESRVRHGDPFRDFPRSDFKPSAGDRDPRRTLRVDNDIDCVFYAWRELLQHIVGVGGELLDVGVRLDGLYSDGCGATRRLCD